MRTCLSPLSSIRLMRATRASSPGKRARTSSRNRRLISKMISRWRGSNERNQLQRPLFQRLGEQRVIRVRERLLCHVPRLVPAEVLHVEKDAHELGDRERRVSVIELDRDLVRHPVPVRVRAPKTPGQVCQRAGDEEVLLHEAQRAAACGRIIRVQHAGQRLGHQRFGQRPDELAGAELLKIEIVRRDRAPQSQGVDRLAAVTDDRSIERNAAQASRGDRG